MRNLWMTLRALFQLWTKAAERLLPSRLPRLLLRPAKFDLEQRNRLVLPPHTQLTADIQLSPN
jgi:hypothetical protein